MKKSYQERLDEVACPSVEEITEIQDLDSILELPHPLREVSLVKAICDGYRKSKKTGPKTRRTSLAAWVDSPMKGQNQDSQN